MNTRIRIITVLAIGAAALCLPSLAAAATGAFDVDLRTASGTRVAAVAGSVNARGTGYAQIVPLSGAPSVGMVRDETAMATRQADGSVLIRGGLGTRIVIRLRADAGTADATGRLALALHGVRSVDVSGTGVATDRPYVPRKGDVVIAIGYPKGPIRTAMARRYRVVRYAPSMWSRTALLAHPNRIGTVAGVLVGPSVTAARLRHIDIVRALYNAGRWAAVSSSPAAFDRHMYVLAHAHLGRGGVILRHPGGLPGQASRTFLQIREPRTARIRVGAGRIGRDRLPKSEIIAAARRGTDHLVDALAARENATGIPAAKARRAGSPSVRQASSCPPPTGSSPATVCATQSNGAYYAVPINQHFEIVLTTSNALVANGLQWQCSSTESGTAFFTGACPAQTVTQAMSIDFNPVYNVALNPNGGTAVPNQIVTETSDAEFNAVAAIGGPLAAGTYNNANDVVAPLSWDVPMYYGSGEGCRFGCYMPAASSLQQSGLQLALAYHSVVTDCTQCSGTAGTGATVEMDENTAISSPQQQQAQLSGNYSDGSNWSTSIAASSGFSLEPNLGFFGGESTGGIGGGYSSDTTTTNTVGGDIEQSVGFSLSNWVTNPVYGEGPTSTSAQATYTMSSYTIPNAGGTAAYAASSLQYPTAINSSNGGYVNTPAQYGGNGPAPNCAGNAAACVNASPISAWGSSENVVNFTQGAVASFDVTVDSPTSQLGIGSVSPWVNDTFYVVDQWNVQGNNSYSSIGGQGPGIMSFTQLQFLGQDTLTAATMAGSASATPTNDPNGMSVGGGITVYYNAQGQVVDPPNAPYSTVGLDLCAPPVLTAEMWSAGCDQDASLAGADNPPATVAGANPTITVNGRAPTVQTVNNAPQQVAPLGSTLTCNPGTWSGDPTLSYTWEAYAATGVWIPVKGQTGQTFTPSAAGTYTCDVTAVNAAAPMGIQALSASVQMYKGS